VARFLGLDTSRERVARAVVLSSADQMRNLERKQSDRWSLTKNTRSNKPFVGSATAGEGKRVLSEASLAAIEEAWGKTMCRLGYQRTVRAGLVERLDDVTETS